MSYTEGFAHATFQVAETQEETQSILNSALEEAAAMVKNGLTNTENVCEEVEAIIDYDEEAAEDEDEVAEELENVVRVIPDYVDGERKFAIQAHHSTEENISYYYELMVKVLAPKMITPYSSGVSGCYDSREGFSSEAFFIRKNGEVVWAAELAKALLV
jgi:hypothetical protein